MADKIYIQNLHLRTILGIFDWEREKKQDLRINLCLSTDIQNASKSDDIKDAVDYKKITKDIISLVENSSYQLIEALVEHITTHILSHYPVSSVTARVDKPGALRFAESVGVEITRHSDSIENE